MEHLIVGVLSVFISLRNLVIRIFLQEPRDLQCKKYFYLNKTQINGSLKFYKFRHNLKPLSQVMRYYKIIDSFFILEFMWGEPLLPTFTRECW